MGSERQLGSLTLSFAVFGAVITYLALSCAASLEVDVSPSTGVVFGSLSGGLLGVGLRRWSSLREPLAASEVVRAKLGAALAILGAATEYAIGVWENERLSPFSLAGSVLAILSMPACLAASESAARMARARAGSLVARAQRHRVHASLAATTSVFGALGASFFCLFGRDGQVRSGLIVSAGIVGASLAILLWALLGVRRIETEIVELGALLSACVPTEPGDHQGRLPCDMGLGSERWSHHRPTNAYRGYREAFVVVRGNLDAGRALVRETRAQFERSLRRAGLAIGLAALVVGLIESVPILRPSHHESTDSETPPIPAQSEMPNGLSFATTLAPATIRMNGYWNQVGSERRTVWPRRARPVRRAVRMICESNPAFCPLSDYRCCPGIKAASVIPGHRN